MRPSADIDYLGRYISRWMNPTTEYRRVRYVENRKHRYAHLYNTGTWRRLKQEVIGNEPLCRMCGKLAEEVDHIRKHNGDEELFSDIDNLQPLCKPCHRAKTRAERSRW